MMNNSDEDESRKGYSSTKRAKLSKLACTRCRGMKAKCVLHQPANGKCLRCTRLSYDCVWVEAQKRGRRATTSSKGSEPFSGAFAHAGVSASHHTSTNDEGRNQSMTKEFHGSSRKSSSASPPKRSIANIKPVTENSYDPSPQSTSNRSYHNPDSLRDDTSPQSNLPRLSMMELAQAKEQAVQGLNAFDTQIPPFRQANLEKQPEADPIDMHVLSELDACQLFDHYHKKMNGFIILLDFRLHTVEHVRRTSHTLFSTILAVSAKFIRPQLYQPLLMHARHLTGRGIIDGKVSLGLIQSILLQVYWKEPDDSSAWIRVGEAIRMGYQMHLHRHRVDPLPDDELEARLVLDRERTWIDLCAFDQTFFLQSAEEEDGFHQTCMIPHFRINVKAWLKETISYGVEDDQEQGANFEWIKMQRLSRDIPHARPGNARALGQHVQGTLEAAYEQYLNPSSQDAFKTGTRPWVRVNFWLAAASLALTRAMLIAIGNEGELLAEWVVASSAFVDALEIVARHGYIQYWQDTLGITLYSMGEFSVRIYADVYPATQKSIVEWIERIHHACELCVEGQTESTAAFLSRFFQLCLRAIHRQSNTPPEDIPQQASNLNRSYGMNENIVPSTGAFATPTHLGNASQAPPASFDDASYWESIFPGVSTDWSWLLQSLEHEMPAE